MTLKLKSAGFRLRTRARHLMIPTQLANVLYETGLQLLAREIDGTAFRLIGIGVSGLERGRRRRSGRPARAGRSPAGRRPSGPWTAFATASAATRSSVASSMDRAQVAAKRRRQSKKARRNDAPRSRSSANMATNCRGPSRRSPAMFRSPARATSSTSRARSPRTTTASSTGLLGDTMNVVQGGNAAELAAVNILSADRLFRRRRRSTTIKRVLKLTVLVASTPEFTEQHLVANGASNLHRRRARRQGQARPRRLRRRRPAARRGVEVEAIVEVE